MQIYKKLLNNISIGNKNSMIRKYFFYFFVAVDIIILFNYNHSIAEGLKVTLWTIATECNEENLFEVIMI